MYIVIERLRPNRLNATLLDRCMILHNHLCGCYYPNKQANLKFLKGV